MTIGEFVASLSDDQRLAIAANLDDMQKWEQQLAKSNNDPVHAQTAVLLQMVGKLVQLPEETAVAEMGKGDKTTADKKRSGRRWVEPKTIKGREYDYWRWYEGNRKRSEYIGPAKKS